MFMITAGELGLDFAAAKTVAAIGFGLLGGFGTMAISRTKCFRFSAQDCRHARQLLQFRRVIRETALEVLEKNLCVERFFRRPWFRIRCFS